MKAEHIIFPCGRLKLEGIYFNVEKPASPAVVVTHPHPYYGGSMKNNVIYAIVGALAGVDIAALIFNFRGVGESEGVYGAGIEEQNDIKAALNWLMQQPGVNAHKMGLAGYSFGGGVALPVACADERVKGLVLISPYFERSPSALLKTCAKHMLIVGGSKDLQVSMASIKVYGREAAGPVSAKIMEGPDHFWNGYEREMAKAVADFFSELFK
ncbi:MAG: alpha/beta fold hydrolase [Dehalococcoidia bacterium]|jgi:alpha/beta superfamily hydrolase